MNKQVAVTLAARRQEILDTWIAKIEKRTKAQWVPREALLNNIPLIIDELTEALRKSAAMTAVVAIPRRVAESHGEGRLELGFSLAELGEEYNSLRESILEALDSANVRLDNATAAALHAAVDQAHRFGVERYINLQQSRLLERQSEFIALLVHDFRGPLSNVLTGTQQLRTATAGDERATKTLDRMDRGVRRVLALVERELSAAQALSGDLHIHVSQFDAKPLIEDTVEMLRLKAEAKSLRLEVSIEEGCRASTDPLLLGQVIQNLLDNGIKYTASGQIRLDARNDGGVLALTVEDTGRGISKDMLPLIFQLYRRSENTSPGRGIGLAVTKSIVDALGGTISVTSVEGAGTRFEVRIPNKADDTALQPSAAN
ncbi:MAG: ATP-binding protein [Myxococcaceae bacterium]